MAEAFRDGDAVAAGQPLAIIDPADPDAARRDAETTKQDGGLEKIHAYRTKAMTREDRKKARAALLVETGEALFVPAGVEHRFEDFTDDFAAWVVFYGPEGGERP